MTKYILSLLGWMLSLVPGMFVYADTLSDSEPWDIDVEISTSYEEPNYYIRVHNLPIEQPFGESFTLMTSIFAQFTDEEKDAILTIDECGELLATLPLTLMPDTDYDFSVVVEKDTPEPCILTFSLLDTDQTLLTSTQVGFLPQCPGQRTRAPIDEGLDYTIPEIQQQEIVSPSASSTSSSASQHSNLSSNVQKAPAETAKIQTSTATSSQPRASSQEPILVYQDTELQAAFDLLVSKDILTEQDLEHLKAPLTRIQAAELFVKIWTMKNLSKSTNKACAYADMAGLSPDQQEIAQLACQYNIMWIHPDATALENFMPNDIMPSEQLVTAFSRLLRGSLFESENESTYFEQHMSHMLEVELIDAVSLQVHQTLSDFVILTSRSIEQGYLTIAPQTETRKRIFRFW